MKEFIDYILQFGYLDQSQTDRITKRAKEIHLRKNEYFLEAGSVLKQVGFVVEGVFRIGYYNHKGEDITRYFIQENQMMFNPYKDEIFSESIQAVTDCKLVVFSDRDWKEISGTIEGWEAIIQKITAKTLTEKLQRRSPLVEQDATTRYLAFMENFPMLINRVPLSYIASYLGVTQSSLSRIRRGIL